MARKPGDLMSLLAHRGSMRRRGKASGLQKFFSVLRTVMAGRSSGGPSTRRSAGNGSVVLATLAFTCLAIGYLLGSVFPWNGGDAADPLIATQGDPVRSGLVPGPIGERLDLQPLSSTFLLTAAYPGYAAASEAAGRLHQSGLETARPYQLQRGFGLVVYYDGPQAEQQVRATLESVAAPDVTFADYRKRGKGWPIAGSVR